MELFRIPAGENIKTIAVPIHPLEFWIKNWGGIDGVGNSLHPHTSEEIPLFTEDGYANFAAFSRLKENRKAKPKKKITPAGSFVGFVERCGTKNDGVALAPVGVAPETVEMIVNYVYTNSDGIHQVTDEMDVLLTTAEGEMNVRVTGVAKLAAVRERGKAFNYSIVQPGSHLVDGYMQRAVELMQYLIENKDIFQEGVTYWGADGKEIKNLVTQYLKSEGAEALETFKGNQVTTRLIRLVHSFSGKNGKAAGSRMGGVFKRFAKPNFGDTFSEAIEKFNMHENPFRERTLRLVLTAIIGKVAQYSEDYSAVRLVNPGILSQPQFEQNIRDVGINQQYVTKVLKAMPCVSVVGTRQDASGEYDLYRVSFMPDEGGIDSPVFEGCRGCGQIKRCYAAKQRRDAWVRSKSNGTVAARSIAERYLTDLGNSLAGDRSGFRIIIV